MPSEDQAAAGDFARGDRVLLRDRPLLGPLIVDHPEPNGPAYCVDEDACPGWAAGRSRAYNQCELAPCPPEYELPPPADRHWETLGWINRNRAVLEETHGIRAVAIAEEQVRRRIILAQQIAIALAAEPEANAMRRAEIAFAEAGR